MILASAMQLRGARTAGSVATPECSGADSGLLAR
jgi:hypothetical protein